MARARGVSQSRGAKELKIVQAGRGENERHWVFGYGSLVDAGRLSRFLAARDVTLGAHEYCRLHGFKRTWSVAMDNALTLPGYKYYLDPATGARPPVYVAFLNIETAGAGTDVAGILFEVDAAALKVLDARERNYDRVDVTPSISAAVDGTVWSYVGHAQAAARYRQGLARRALVIEEAYRHAVTRAFAQAQLPYADELPFAVRSVALTRVDT
jgi:cation transport regulator ChaC